MHAGNTRGKRQRTMAGCTTRLSIQYTSVVVVVMQGKARRGNFIPSQLFLPSPLGSSPSSDASAIEGMKRGESEGSGLHISWRGFTGTVYPRCNDRCSSLPTLFLIPWHVQRASFSSFHSLFYFFFSFFSFLLSFYRVMYAPVVFGLRGSNYAPFFSFFFFGSCFLIHAIDEFSGVGARVIIKFNSIFSNNSKILKTQH